MTFIWAIPDALVLVILGEWCDYRCAAKLDSAFCNRKTRNWLLELLPKIHFKTDFTTIEWDWHAFYRQRRPFFMWILFAVCSWGQFLLEFTT